MHAYGGMNKVGRCNLSWYDVVIPNYFDISEFEFTPEDKEDYFLFVGRVYEGKGIHIIQDIVKGNCIHKLKVGP